MLSPPFLLPPDVGNLFTSPDGTKFGSLAAAREHTRIAYALTELMNQHLGNSAENISRSWKLAAKNQRRRGELAILPGNEVWKEHHEWPYGYVQHSVATVQACHQAVTAFQAQFPDSPDAFKHALRRLARIDLTTGRELSEDDDGRLYRRLCWLDRSSVVEERV